MKIALFIEDGLEQIVLTPQSDVETNILKKLDSRELTIHRGDFYRCEGGWMMHSHGRSDHKSTILVLTKDDSTPLKIKD